MVVWRNDTRATHESWEEPENGGNRAASHPQGVGAPLLSTKGQANSEVLL